MAPPRQPAAAVARPRAVVVLPLLGLGVAVSMLVVAGIGAVGIAPAAIASMLAYHVGLLPNAAGWHPAEETILFSVRLPRVVAAALVGAALATAGALFQGLLRNPLADPYIIGSSAGAAFGATLGTLLVVPGLTATLGLVPTLAFVGALCSVLVVYRLSRVGGSTSITSLLLAGMAVSAFLVAAMNLLISVDDRLQLRMRALFSWLFGGISVAGWEQLALVAPAIILLLALTWLSAPALNALAMGEEGASYLGINVARVRMRIIAAATLLTALAVMISGLIGFVGLVVPHAMRLAFGPEHRLLLPASALAGALFLLWTDALARTLLAPAELPVGVITGLIGGPVFLYLLSRARGGYVFS